MAIHAQNHDRLIGGKTIPITYIVLVCKKYLALTHRAHIVWRIFKYLVSQSIRWVAGSWFFLGRAKHPL